MDTDFPSTILLWLEGFRQHVPAQHFAYFRGYVGNVSNMLLAVSYQHAEFIAIYK